MNKEAIIVNDLINIFENVTDIEYYNEKSILITGCNGMLGKSLVDFFSFLITNHNFKIQIYALSRSSQRMKKNFKEIWNESYFTPIIQDISDSFEFSYNFDLVFHAASNTNPTDLQERPVSVHKANTLGTIGLLDYITNSKNTPKAKFVFFSTREIYGDSDKEMLSESDYGVINPEVVRNSYPISKINAESLIRAYSSEFGLDYCIARIAHVYGPGMPLNDGRIMSDIIGDAALSNKIKLNSDGSTLRSVCYITDAITALLTIASITGANSTYNISNEYDPRTIYDIAQVASKIREIPVEILNNVALTRSNTGYNNMRTGALDTSKLESLGWSPKITIEKGLENCVRYYENE